MVLNNGAQTDRSFYFLLPVLVLALFIAFIPNLHYAYPVHIDEWVHIAHGEALLHAGDITYPEPFTGQPVSGLVSRLEVGFHVFTGVFHSISGIAWVDMVRYLPSVILAITALAVYVLTRRLGFGWEAAFFTCLIPTTVGIMGPAFFIPLALALPFIPLSLFLVFNYRSFWSYLLLLIFIGFVIVTHVTTAIGFVLVIVPCVLLYLLKEPKHGIILLLMGVIPFLVTLPWTYRLIADTAATLFVPKPLPAGHDLPMLLRTYGYLPFGVGLLGTFWLAWKGGVKNYSLVFGLMLLVAMLAVFYTLHYGVDPMYLRGMHYALLMFGIAGGAGLMAIKDLKIPERFITITNPYLRRVGYPLCLIVIAVTLVIAIPARQAIPYYHMIDENDYETFVWVRDNVDIGYQKAVLDPWKATAFTAITGRYVYARTHMGPDEFTQQADAFLAAGCKDTDFLRKNGISIVCTSQACTNPDLLPVRNQVYLLPE